MRYAHHRTGNLVKRALEARASACDNIVRTIDDNLQRAELRLQRLRHDLVGNAPSVPVHLVDFTRIPPGSTVIFSTAGRPLSHAAMMLDLGQMAHLVQSLTSREALTRPDLGRR